MAQISVNTVYTISRFSERGLIRKGGGIFTMLSKIYVFSKETKTGVEKSTFHTSVKSHTTSSPQTLHQIHRRYFFTQIMYCNAPTIKENVGFLLRTLKSKQRTKPKPSISGAKSSLPWHKASPLSRLFVTPRF